MTEETPSVARSDRTPDARPPRNASYELASHAVDAMLDKKAHDVVVLDLRGVNGVAEFFVLGTGSSDLQVRAISNAVEDQIKETCDERPWHTEGTDHLQWVLLDYVNLVVHIFSEEKRGHYDLERLWGEAESEHVPAEGDASDVALLEEAVQAARRAGNG